MSENIVAVTNESFMSEVLQAEIPVLVDFWAPWCGPCKMVAPVLEVIAQEYAGRLKVAKVNVDEGTDIASKYSIRGIPTLIIFKDGQAVATKVGAMSKAQLADFIDEHI